MQLLATLWNWATTTWRAHAAPAVAAFPISSPHGNVSPSTLLGRYGNSRAVAITRISVALSLAMGLATPYGPTRCAIRGKLRSLPVILADGVRQFEASERTNLRKGEREDIVEELTAIVERAEVEEGRVIAWERFTLDLGNFWISAAHSVLWAGFAEVGSRRWSVKFWWFVFVNVGFLALRESVRRHLDWWPGGQNGSNYLYGENYFKSLANSFIRSLYIGDAILIGILVFGLTAFATIVAFTDPTLASSVAANATRTLTSSAAIIS